MNDEHYNGGIWAESSRPDRVPSLLSGFVYAVWTHQAAFVFERQGRHFK